MIISNETKISHITTAFGIYALGDIRNCHKHGMPIAAFILAACFIDQLSGFIYDNKKRGQKDNTSRSKKFVAEYLNKVSKKPYDKDDLIDLLRNKLVHNYSLFDKKIPNHIKYMLEWENPNAHLCCAESPDHIVLNIERFINDLENAFKSYREQLLTDTEVQRIAFEHYDEFGVLVLLERQINIVDNN